MYGKYLKIMEAELPLGESFDLLEREVIIGGRKGTMFFVDGLTDGELMQRVMDYLMKVQPEDMEGIVTSSRFIAGHLPFLDATLAAPKTENGPAAGEPRSWTEEQIRECCAQAQTRLYAGLVPLLVEGYGRVILVDLRYMPGSSLQDYVDISGADALFLYSTLVLNNSTLLRW